jgi:ribosomal protein S18 acetylase RimI-like enzyme
MTAYRAFRNTDPPALAELWCNHPPQRGLAQPMTTRQLEKRVFSQPYFDRQGLIVAEEEGRVVGFVHAGFGSNTDGSAVSTTVGATQILMVAPHAQKAPLARELLHRSEQYLIGHGARTLFGGITYPANAFYLGLYGGSLSPGVLESHAEFVGLFRGSGYVEVERHAVMQRVLSGFRPIVNRQQVQIRRQYRVEAEFDPRPKTWWEACTIGQSERIRHRIVSRRDGSVCGEVTFWDMDRVSSGWGAHAMGLMDLEINSQLRRQGLGTYLVGEALRSMHEAGMSQAEVQMEEDNLGAIALFRKLGFQPADHSLVLRKTVE